MNNKKYMKVVFIFSLSLLLFSAIPLDGFLIGNKNKNTCNKMIETIIIPTLAANSDSEFIPSTSTSAAPSQCRRSWMGDMFLRTSSIVTLATITTTTTTNLRPAFAAMALSGDQKVIASFESLTMDQAKERFLLARKEIQYLLDNYSSISKEGGGDAVRRYLGTVGVNGAMYGIGKVVKKLRDEADDIVEYTETMDEFNAYLYQAEGAAYQSIFAEHSSAKATPESCLATAKQDVIMMAKYMDELQSQLNL
eukprot:scaffold6312_cov85-Cylindrotheca_fusiformis.AAC.4